MQDSNIMEAKESAKSPPVVPLVKQTILRSSGFGGCWDMKSAHQNSMQLVKSQKTQKITWMCQKQTYNWLLKITFPQSLENGEQKKLSQYEHKQ